jgi:hypothetical protein
VTVNLTKYLGQGKIDDTISLDDLGILLIFEVEITKPQ